MSPIKPFTIALAGNPNVGKSTIFNALTRMHQKTGNWAGKTVACAYGTFHYRDSSCLVVDLPGTYSLFPHSEEEEIARNYIASGQADLLLLICDATCPERGLRLLKQIRELSEDRYQPVIICINLCDEAEKKGIELNFDLLSETLRIPVIPCMARSRQGVKLLKEKIYEAQEEIRAAACGKAARESCTKACDLLPGSMSIPDFSPSELASRTVSYHNPTFLKRQIQIDRVVTGPFTGGAIMLLLLMAVFWLTITGANYPSALLWNCLFSLEGKIASVLQGLGTSAWLIQALVFGIYRVVAWIVSVMLPPMAIFFPLFTILEDLGYLPRAAFNMDCAFKKCCACGKQCLTMAMGFGCNAAGVVGCRIIDSPRERLIAILTNSMVPCNGRFPTLILLITLFFMGFQDSSGGILSSLTTALVLTAFILLGIAATLGTSLLLSKTVLKGVPSSFTLELPPYRRPQFGKVLVRSVFDRTLFVLLRAVAVAAPAGLLIWILGNCFIGDKSLLLHLSSFLDPLGALLGMDGMILVGFILGFPANEIVIPIILMGYLQTGHLVEMSDPSVLMTLFASHGWTLKTAVCMAVFCLFHWPCSTTCLTIKKETGSLRWALAAFLLPTFLGCFLCFLIQSFF